jgi:hypothetical protein
MLLVRHRTAFAPRAVALCAVALLLASLAVVGTAAPAKAACTYPTFRVFPGSATGRVRYAEVNFSFEACSDQSPSSWVGKVTRQAVNSTGKNLGFFIDGVFVRTDASGSSYKWFTGIINASTCVPRVGWPCSRSYTFTAQYQLSLDRFGNVQAYQGALSAPIGMALFTTP